MTTIQDEMKAAIEAAIEDSSAEVSNGNGPGHFEIRVVAKAFEGKKLLDKQRMVLGSIKHLMAGDRAPVHAVDKILTLTE